MTSYDRFICKNIFPLFSLSFRLLRKNLGKWFTAPPPPPAKNCPYAYGKIYDWFNDKKLSCSMDTRAFFCPVVCQAMKENYLIWKVCLDGNTAENSYCKSVKICTFLSTKLNGSHFGDNSLDSFVTFPLRC